MKPQHLKWPFSRYEKKLQILDGVWYVPLLPKEPPADFVFPGWEALFGNANPIHVEYCSGNGAWIADRAEADPSTNWVAIERKFDRVRRIWSKAKNRGVQNLFIICGEGFRVTHHFFPGGSIQQVYINFPDPWPKTRHFKNRIIQTPFVQEISRILKPDGGLTLVTDDAPFSSWSLKIVLSDATFDSLHPEPYFTTSLEGYGSSTFEKLWRENGRTIRYHQFKKRHLCG